MSNGMHQRPSLLRTALVGGLIAGLASMGRGVIDRMLQRTAPPSDDVMGHGRRNRARRIAHPGPSGVAAAKRAKRCRRNIAKHPRGSA
jgi:hypothetical protein